MTLHTDNRAMLERLAGTMQERQLQESVRSLCQNLGLLYYHTHDARHSPGGYPDCMIASPTGGLIVRELKRQHEQPTATQQLWLDAMDASGLDVGVWRPLQLLDRTIARELVALSGRRYPRKYS